MRAGARPAGGTEGDRKRTAVWSRDRARARSDVTQRELSCVKLLDTNVKSRLHGLYIHETGNRQKWLLPWSLRWIQDGITDWGLWPRYRFAKASRRQPAAAPAPAVPRRPKPLDAQRWVSPKLGALRGSVLPGTTLTSVPCSRAASRTPRLALRLAPHGPSLSTSMSTADLAWRRAAMARYRPAWQWRHALGD